MSPIYRSHVLYQITKVMFYIRLQKSYYPFTEIILPIYRNQVMLYIRLQKSCYPFTHLQKLCYISDYFWKRSCLIPIYCNTFIYNIKLHKSCPISYYRCHITHLQVLCYHLQKSCYLSDYRNHAIYDKSYNFY